MTRRAAVLTAITAIPLASQSKRIDLSTLPGPVDALLQLTIEATHTPKYFLVIQAEGRTIRLTTREVLDILEGK